MKIKNFDELVKNLQINLKDYLEEKGIDTDTNFSCLNPTHNDMKPSMSLIKPDNIRVYCHSCGVHGDIFDVCSWLDKKPLTGNGFNSETLPYLAKKFDIAIEHTEITEEEQYQIDTYRAYRHAYEYITSWEFKKLPSIISDELKRRKWDLNETKLKELGVGHVEDPVAFRNYLKSVGFSAGFLDDIDLSRKDIFSPGHLIFTTKDESGRPVGFAARNLIPESNGPKYINQKTTGVKCNIYQKGKRLFGLDQVLKNKHKGTIYVMEGYSDVISCHLNGFYPVVATCGTAFTDDHILSLKENGFYNIVLSYDNDAPGQERTQNILDKKFSEHKDLTVSILTIPSLKDPDEFIRENGIEEYKNIRPVSAFKWRLFRFDESIEASVVCQIMIPFIASEPSPISREKQISELSAFTGFSTKVIQEELNRIFHDKERQKDKEHRLIIDRMIHDLKEAPANAHVILSDTQSKIYNLHNRYDENTLSEESTLHFIQDIKNKEESIKENGFGFNLGPDLKAYQKATLGEWKDTLQVFGGKANSGKTSFLVKLGYEIASREENNAIVIYHTIDDSTEQLLPKWVCVAEGSASLEINQVKNPNYWKNSSSFNQISAKRESGYNKIINLIKDGKIIIKDTNQGSSISYARFLIKYYKDKYPDKNIVYILDNFHKLRDFENLDERNRFKQMSQIMKNLAVEQHIAILCTMEYTKLAAGVKPTNDNIAESVQMEYDANFIAHLWSGLHDLKERATKDMYFVEAGEDGPEKLPVVEINVGKNKLTSFKGTILQKFYPSSSDFKYHEAVIHDEVAQPEPVKNKLKLI